ncbi:MAG TPA: hypothetical protein PKJ56_08300, partial [Promineifilum sp.]|nr:hypothetical protein [Promineifilum sp.]
FTITLGSWLGPTIVTVAAITCAWWPDRREYIGKQEANGIVRLVAIIFSLLAWLIWSLLS